MIFPVLLSRLGAIAALAAALFAVAVHGTVANAREPQSHAVASVALSGLPAEARDVVARIHRGGPFAYERDGSVFGNFEGVLPGRNRGYYREYTVPTPGLAHRGARRIVAGRGGELYYTDDHYRSFRRIDE